MERKEITKKLIKFLIDKGILDKEARDLYTDKKLTDDPIVEYQDCYCPNDFINLNNAKIVSTEVIEPLVASDKRKRTYRVELESGNHLSIILTEEKNKVFSDVWIKCQGEGKEIYQARIFYYNKKMLDKWIKLLVEEIRFYFNKSVLISDFIKSCLNSEDLKDKIEKSFLEDYRACVTNFRNYLPVFNNLLTATEVYSENICYHETVNYVGKGDKSLNCVLPLMFHKNTELKNEYCGKIKVNISDPLADKDFSIKLVYSDTSGEKNFISINPIEFKDGEQVNTEVSSSDSINTDKKNRRILLVLNIQNYKTSTFETTSDEINEIKSNIEYFSSFIYGISEDDLTKFKINAARAVREGDVGDSVSLIDKDKEGDKFCLMLLVLPMENNK
jgi:hypothetical protein